MAITPNRNATNDSDLREINVSSEIIAGDTTQIAIDTSSIAGDTTNIAGDTNNILVDTTSIDTKTGEVSATPTANTVLDRLKTIGTNTSNSALNQVFMRPTEFEISTEITRPANTTAYAINQICNTGTDTVLPTLDFTTIGGVASRKIQINNISVISDNGAVATRMLPTIHLFNAETITGQTITDASAFNPTYTETISKRVVSFQPIYTTIVHGSGFYMLQQTEIMRNAVLDANGKLYVALIQGNAYVPTSGEKITITLKGYLL